MVTVLHTPPVRCVGAGWMGTGDLHCTRATHVHGATQTTSPPPGDDHLVNAAKAAGKVR